MTAAHLKRAAVRRSRWSQASSRRAKPRSADQVDHRLRAHGGQWALPGGRCDEGETVSEAALRELDEQLGVRLGQESASACSTIIRRARAISLPRSCCGPGRACACCRIGPSCLGSSDPFARHRAEDVVSFPTIPESDRPLVRVFINGNFINAPTAALIYQFREMLAGRLTRVATFEQPVFAWR